MRLDGPYNSMFRAAETLGDAWSWLILREALTDDIRRFTDFQHRLGISRHTLSSRLRHLVDERLLAVCGSRGGYELTDAGEGFFDCVAAAEGWGRRWSARTNWSDISQHTVCGQTFEPVFVCASCREPIDPHRVTATLPASVDADHVATPVVRQRTIRLDLLDRVRSSPASETLSVIGDRWSMLVIQDAFLRTRRFDQFSAHIGVAPNILAQRLQRLVALGVLDRRPYSDAPPRHEYRLTEKGLDLYPVPLSVIEWGRRWLTDTHAIQLTHRRCRARLEPILTCGHCRLPASRQDVSYRPLPTPTYA